MDVDTAIQNFVNAYTAVTGARPSPLLASDPLFGSYDPEEIKAYTPRAYKILEEHRICNYPDGPLLIGSSPRAERRGLVMSGENPDLCIVLTSEGQGYLFKKSQVRKEVPRVGERDLFISIIQGILSSNKTPPTSGDLRTDPSVVYGGNIYASRTETEFFRDPISGLGIEWVAVNYNGSPAYLPCRLCEKVG